MICHTCMKFIFVWIFLIPQPTGYVFIWDYPNLKCPIHFPVTNMMRKLSYLCFNQAGDIQACSRIWL